jgi:NAD-dependent oxidoreductase involved in siderophore biosynthesis
MDTFDDNRIDPAIEEKINALLRKMTLVEKVGQLVLENAFAPIDWSEVLRKQKIADEMGQPFQI